MDNQQFEYKVVISPNLKFRQKRNSFEVLNTYNGNKVSFGNDSIKSLLEYFSEPRKISDATNVMDGDIIKNREVIKKLIEWDFLIVDLGLKERDCPLCHSNNCDLLVEHQNNYYQKRFKYVKCNDCGFVFLNPAPDENALNFFYSFKNYYSVIPLSSHQKYEKKLERKSNELRTSILKNYCQLNKSTKVLDVGSGTGNFASYLNMTFGCPVTCIDKDPQALSFIAQKSPQIKTIQHDFKNANIETKFDVITMWGYIEHEYDPLSTLKKASDLLKQGGIMIIDAPNIDGKLAHKSLQNWPYLHSPYHMSHFGPSSMKRLLEMEGFSQVDMIYKKTGSYLLKYSENVLYNIYKYKLFYSSRFVDRIVYELSKLFLLFEDDDNRLIIIATKNE